MATYQPITVAVQLPAAGARLTEHAALDFKRTVDPTKSEELAKDVAAFANHLGGVIIVGAVERAGALDEYLPFDAERAADIIAAYERAVSDRCSPRPPRDIVPLEREGGTVIAVNVPPYTTQVVGVRTASSTPDKPAWIYPVRTGTHTRFLSAEHLPMHMDPKLRRVLVLLDGIPDGAAVFVRYGTRAGSMTGGRFSFHGANVEHNVIVCRVREPGHEHDQLARRFPLDQVRTVFCDTAGWEIIIDPHL